MNTEDRKKYAAIPFVLSELRNYNISKQPLTYSIYELENKPASPSYQQQHSALSILEQTGLLKILNTHVSYLHPNSFVFHYELKIDQPLFNSAIKQLSEFPETAYVNKARLFFNSETGIGYLNGNRFVFKNNRPKYDLFKALYENINTTLPLKEVVKVAKLDKENNLAYQVNELITDMRRKTGLTKDQLTNNNGNLSLVVEKLDQIP